jgi:hypothetical protein
MFWRIVELDGIRSLILDGEPIPAGAIEIGQTADPDCLNPPVPVPESVTPKQIRLALNRAGLRDIVEQTIAGLDQDVRDIWEFAQEVRRDDPLVVMLGEQFGANLDDLFRLAATL